MLDRDYLTVPEDHIRFVRPVMTVVGCKVVYEAGRSGIAAVAPCYDA